MSVKSDAELLAEGTALFQSEFPGCALEVIAFGPGRVNLIGEHTDYNGGFVLPFALPLKTIVIGSKAAGSVSTICSTIPGMDKASFVIDAALTKGEPAWSNYVKGTIAQYFNDLPPNAAVNMVVVSSVPLGSGLSSSAALEVATATFLEKLYNIENIDGVKKALRCQKAEHDFAGTPCGIMDQYISANGKEGHLLLIDCKTNKFELVPFSKNNSDAPVILVTNSNVKHELSGSEYPDRVNQCKEAVAIIQKAKKSVKLLRDVTPAMLEQNKTKMSDLVYRRANHVINEDVRTQETVKALKVGDYGQVGKLMTASHNSLRDLYEVSCKELDILVDIALSVPGVHGSRMTGGGFGGCTVTLVDKSAVNQLKDVISTKYTEATGLTCDCYVAEPSPGCGYLTYSCCCGPNCTCENCSCTKSDSASCCGTSCACVTRKAESSTSCCNTKLTSTGGEAVEKAANGCDGCICSPNCSCAPPCKCRPKSKLVPSIGCGRDCVCGPTCQCGEGCACSLKSEVATSSSFMSWVLPMSILGIGVFFAFRYYRRK